MARKQHKNKRLNSFDPDLRQVIAWRIHEGRQNAYPQWGGLTQCAVDFGIAPQQWSQYEKGHRSPEDSNLEKIAAHLKTTVQHLMTPPKNWASIREEWQAARLKAKRKPIQTSLQETEVDQARVALRMAATQTSSTDGGAPDAGIRQQDTVASHSESQNSRTLEIIRKIITADHLRSEGIISAEDLSSTLKSVDILIDALCRDITR